MPVIAYGSRRWRTLLWPDFDEVEAERLDLEEDAEQRGPIFEQADEHGLASFPLTLHRGKGGLGGRSEATLDADRVQGGWSGHMATLRLDLVSRRRRNPVIVRALSRRRS